MALDSSAELHKFISAAKEHGATDESLISILENAGWPKAAIVGALGERYEALTGMRVPRGKKSTTPAKDAFLYLLSFATLATWTIALGSICYSLIDHWIPDPLYHNYGTNLSYQISAELAALMVTFPLYLLVMRIILSGTRQAPEKLESSIRKWLTYLALLIAAGVMIGDVIAFLAYFLHGDLTSRFVGKVAVTLLISTGVFWYYLGSLREARARQRPMRLGRDSFAALLATIVVVIVVALGFRQTRGPNTQRLLRTDAKRAQNLSQLANQVNNHYRQNGNQLPVALTDFQNKQFADPITGKPPEYKATSSNSYTLCTTFSANSPQDERSGDFLFWTHSAGHQCFEFNAAENVPPAPFFYH